MNKNSKICWLQLVAILAVTSANVVKGELVAKWPVSSCSGSFVQGLAAQGPVARPMLMVKLKCGSPLVAVTPVANGSGLRSW